MTDTEDLFICFLRSLAKTDFYQSPRQHDFNEANKQLNLCVAKKRQKMFVRYRDDILRLLNKSGW